MSRKLVAKARLIQLPAGPLPERPPRDEGAEPRAKTAPGAMAGFMAAQSTAVREAESLREQLKAFDGARPVRTLDPRAVQPSRWANRHAASYAEPAFQALKRDILSAGGNVQPVAVRALAASGAADGSPVPATHELIYGHRRHRACLELGLPLQALVTDASDHELFEAMDRENRARKNLSAWEQGMMYRRALDGGLYPSQRRLALALGVDVALVSRSLALARLPAAVVAAFASPLEIQFRWAQPLAEVLQRDPEGVIQRAQRAQQCSPRLPAPQVLALLLGADAEPVSNRATAQRQLIGGRAGAQAELGQETDGGVVLRLPAGVLDEAARTELVAWVEKLLASR